MKGRRITGVLLLLAVLAAMLMLPSTAQAAVSLKFYANGGQFVWPDGSVEDGSRAGMGTVKDGGTEWDLELEKLEIMTQSANILAMPELWRYTEGLPYGSSGLPLRNGPGIRREGFVIAGWYADPECTEKTFSDQTEHYFKKFKHYAKWVPANDLYTYQVTFDFNGGSLLNEDIDRVVCRVAKGEPVLEQRDRAIRSALHSEDQESLVYWSYDRAGNQPVNSPGSVVPTKNMTFYAQYGQRVYPSSMSFAQAALTLKEGESADLRSATDYVKLTRLSYVSDNPDAVWVDQNGHLTVTEDVGTKDEKAVITMKPYGRSNPVATCTVTVKSTKKTIAVTRIDGETETMTGRVGETVTVSAGTPDAGRMFSHWEISPSVSFKNGTGISSSTISFVVPDAAVKLTAVDDVLPLKGVKLAQTTMKLQPGQSRALVLVRTPADAPYQSIAYWSTDENIATVDLQGIVHAHSGGTCTVSCTVNKKFKVSCTVTVPRKAVKKLSFNKSTLKLKKKKKFTLKLKVTPAGAWYKNVSWFASNSKVATVTKKGVVKAKGKGKCTITCTVTTLNGKKKKAKCKVTVK